MRRDGGRGGGVLEGCKGGGGGGRNLAEQSVLLGLNVLSKEVAWEDPRAD